MLNNMWLYGKALLNNLDGRVTPFLSRLWRRRRLKSPAAGDDDISTGEIANVLCLLNVLKQPILGKSMSNCPFENVKFLLSLNFLYNQTASEQHSTEQLLLLLSLIDDVIDTSSEK